jgi:hypothetical protein
MRSYNRGTQTDKSWAYSNRNVRLARASVLIHLDKLRHVQPCSLGYSRNCTRRALRPPLAAEAEVLANPIGPISMTRRGEAGSAIICANM